MNFFNVRRLVHNYIRQDTLMKIIEFLLENRFSNQNKNQSRFKVDKASNVNKKTNRMSVLGGVSIKQQTILACSGTYTS